MESRLCVNLEAMQPVLRALVNHRFSQRIQEERNTQLVRQCLRPRPLRLVSGSVVCHAASSSRHNLQTPSPCQSTFVTSVDRVDQRPRTVNDPEMSEPSRIKIFQCHRHVPFQYWLSVSSSLHYIQVYS